MQRIQRVWRGSLVGKALVIGSGLLALVVVIGIALGLGALLSSSAGAPAPATEGVAILVTIYPSPTGPPEPTSPPTPSSVPTAAPTATPSPEPTSVPAPGQAITVQLTVTDTNDYVNVRSGPGATFSVIGRVEKGQSAAVKGKSQDGAWWLIDLNGQPGWVNAIYARVSGDTGSVPVVAAATATSPPP